MSASTLTSNEQKVSIVTGAASGIGFATASRLLAGGVAVTLVDRNVGNLSKATKDLERRYKDAKILPVACDVSKESEVIGAFNAARNEFGYVDVIVNNAGLMIFKPLDQHTEDDWLRVFSVDLLGAFFFIKQAFLQMEKGGCIVNVSSIHAVETTPLVASYAAAKAGLVSLTHTAAIEGKSKGIRVNAVLPGAVDTPMLWENPNIKSGLEVINTTDVGKPDDIADTIFYLASDRARFVTGASLAADGGRLVRL